MYTGFFILPFFYKKKNLKISIRVSTLAVTELFMSRLNKFLKSRLRYSPIIIFKKELKLGIFSQLKMVTLNLHLLIGKSSLAYLVGK
jgi:hypothetical protein